MDLNYSLEKVLLWSNLAIHLTINQTIKCNIYSSSPLFILAKGYVYSSWWSTPSSRSSTMYENLLQCLQEFLQIKALILQLLCKIKLPQTSSNPWIWCSLNLWILELPVHSFDLFTRVFNAMSSKRTPFDIKNN